MSILRLLFVLALIAVQPLTLRAEELTQSEIENIVREYLLREPEIVYQALQVLQEKQAALETERQEAAIANSQDELFSDDRDPVIHQNGDVTLVEFSDYRCGYCRQVAPSIQSLIADDKNLRVVIKEFPILGEDSVRAAKAALAASQQGKHKEMHFAMMRSRDLTQKAIDNLAISFDMDLERFHLDMESEEVMQHLQDNLDLGQSLGISGTPSFVLGDTLIPGAIGLAQLVEIIAEERETQTQ